MAKIITQEELEDLLVCMCEKQEVCDYFNCQEKDLDKFCKQTYNKTFAQLSKEKKALGKANLRKLQFEHAKSSVNMAVWLGKQYLGQEEKQKIQKDMTFNIINDIPKTAPNAYNETPKEKIDRDNFILANQEVKDF